MRLACLGSRWVAEHQHGQQTETTKSSCQDSHDLPLLKLIERQPGDLGVLREVDLGFREEARIRGFASLPFARFAFVAGSNDPPIGERVNSGIYSVKPALLG